MKMFFKEILIFILIVAGLSVTSGIKAEGAAEASDLLLAGDYMTMQSPVTHHNYQAFKENIGREKVVGNIENKMILKDVFSIKILPFLLLIIVYYVIIRRKANSRTTSF